MLISAIVPTIGRAESLRALLGSLAEQTLTPAEVLVADGSDTEAIAAVVDDPAWAVAGLRVRRIAVSPPNAVRQRMQAIEVAQGDHLLLLDDDVVLDRRCVESMVNEISQSGVVAVNADFSNEPWAGPTPLWRFVLKHLYGFAEGGWQGKVIGPLLRFGYRPSPASTVPMQWLGTCNSLVKRDAYEQVGGFSTFFLHRCTMNEDVDLGLKLNRLGRIVLAPAARLAHFHAAGGRVTPSVAAEDDLFNRYLILRHTLGRSALAAFSLVCFYFAIETAGNIGGVLLRGNGPGVFDRLRGRIRALGRITVRLASRAD